MAAYGEKKAEMERILLKHDWLDKIIFSPSFIYGKYDWTERFYYWLYRTKFFNKILMPGGGPFSLSLTNASDLAEALLQAVEIKKHQTIYNAISQQETTLEEVISITAKALNKPQPEIILLDEKKLISLNLNAGQFPLFMSLNFKVSDNLWTKDFSFKKMDMAATFVEMLEYKAVKGYPVPGVGLSVEKEKEIFNAV